jgi:hypothetical protein
MTAVHTVLHPTAPARDFVDPRLALAVARATGADYVLSDFGGERRLTWGALSDVRCTGQLIALADKAGPIRAADLPDGSVVANAAKAWIKTRPAGDTQWCTTAGSHEHDVHVDRALADGATVLRYGQVA